MRPETVHLHESKTAEQLSLGTRNSGHTLEFICACECAAGEPPQLSPNCQIQVIEDLEQCDRPYLGLIVCTGTKGNFFKRSVLIATSLCCLPLQTWGANPGWELLDTNLDLDRQSHQMAFDSARDVFVLFGGRDSEILADTWEYNGFCFREVVTGNSPSARFWHSMVYDSQRQRTVLFGGGDPDHGIYFDDTWEYDGANWQTVSTLHSPPPRVSRTMVYDSVRNRTVLVGGNAIGASYDDTWEYDGSDWALVDTPVSPPPPGALAAMAFDAERERTVLTFHDGTSNLATWEYDGSNWNQVNTTHSPPGRWAHSMSYDACSQHVVLYGGYSPYFGTGSMMSDTWEYDGIDWTQIVTEESPGPRQQYGIAYDLATGRVTISASGEIWAYTSPNANEEQCGPLPGREVISLKITSPNSVLESKPVLINIPQKSVGVSLSAALVSNGSTAPLDPSQVAYTISHPESHVVHDPESIISIDAAGIAHYNSEGYVSATAATTVDACQLTSGKFFLATGDVYGIPSSDDVIAVFPTGYIPDTSSFSFGDMMSGYPDMMRYLNIAYDVTSEMYGGFHPFKGDKQILAPLVLKNHCGGSGNPMATAPCCYMNCGDASPSYEVIIHEMGHNFADSKGMRQLLESDNGRLDTAGFGECVGSLPVIYFEEEISHNGAAYDIYPGSFEYDYSTDHRDYYCAEPQRGLPEFEQLITDGLSDGIFDNNGLFNGVQVFCSFFEAFSCDYIGGENQYKHQMIRRFLHIFDDTELPEFIPEKVETYFAAAYSVAAGRDMRTKLELWGFTVDDEFYEQILPVLTSKLVNDPDIIFKDSFEGLDNP